MSTAPFADLDQLPTPLTVNSQVLGERVLFAGEHARIHPLNPYVVYRTSELRFILATKPTPAELRSLHQLKRVFGPGTRVETIAARQPTAPVAQLSR